MSSDYYFRKWLKTISNIKELVEQDIELQTSKAHDSEWCEAVHRLNTMLARYTASYNDTNECLEQNLQTQKTIYIKNIHKVIVNRILELKNQIRNLEGYYHQFLSNGETVNSKLTTSNAAIVKVPNVCNRPKNIQVIIEECYQKVNVPVEEIQTTEDATENNKTINWWIDIDEDDENGDINKAKCVTSVYQVNKKVSEETLKRKELITLIQAHEKTRQVTAKFAHQRTRREMWEKELSGTLKPQAPYEIRQRAALSIQKLIRTYFDIKRKRLRDCKLDEYLGLSLCQQPNSENIIKDQLKQLEHPKKYLDYERQSNEQYEQYKKKIIELKGAEIAEDMRDYIRSWFSCWYDEVNYIHEIPKNGGCVSVLKEALPTPAEWQEEYRKFMEIKKANKNKLALQLKWEQQEAKKEKLRLKMEENQKKRLEEMLKQKMMKNPKFHPGYEYPKSKITEQLNEVVNAYLEEWSDLDRQEIDGTKEKYIRELIISEACKDAKIKICETIENDMIEENKLLINALKKDYANNKKEWPEKIKKKRRKVKIKKHKVMKHNDQDITLKLTYLIEKGYIVQYPRTKFEDFHGDSNYAGSDLRCLLKETFHYGAETRAAWWEHCQELFNGRRLLLVGAAGSGKTTLVHIVATLYDAVLYVLHPSQMAQENITPSYLEELVNSITLCAKATQPSIIYFRHVHRLFHSMVPDDEGKNLKMIKSYFIRMLFKRIKKEDKIAIIGSCVDPWLTKGTQMLKKFPSVLLMPDTSYSVVSLILRNWVSKNRIVPSDLNIQSLSHMLQGYPFGYLKEMRQKFLTPERIMRIAAHGLKPQEIYDYITEDDSVTKVDYQRYLKWYNEKTNWGKTERNKLEERKQLELIKTEFKEKMEKKKSKRSNQNIAKTNVTKPILI